MKEFLELASPFPSKEELEASHQPTSLFFFLNIRYWLQKEKDPIYINLIKIFSKWEAPCAHFPQGGVTWRGGRYDPSHRTGDVQYDF